MVLEDATTGKPEIVSVRYVKETGDTFHIYVTRPVYDEQEPINRMNVKFEERLYPLAKVERSSNILQVFLPEGAASPTYTVHKARTISYPTKYWIKQHGKTVASAHRWTENSHMLEVNPELDAALMLCLVAIAEEMEKQD